MSPVGRLDKDSEGLLLFTNDSEWAARITAPESHLEKNLSRADQRAGHPKSFCERWNAGVIAADGEVLRAKHCAGGFAERREKFLDRTRAG